jgi:transposase
VGSEGQAPVIWCRLSWKRLSMAPALAYEPDGSDALVAFAMRTGVYNDGSLIEFLIDIHDLLEGRKVILIWDGLPSHRSKKMSAWTASQRSWLTVERLPGYAHELDHVEGLWGNLKSSELANFCPGTIEELEHKADQGLCRIGEDAQLCKAFVGQNPYGCER